MIKLLVFCRHVVIPNIIFPFSYPHVKVASHLEIKVSVQFSSQNNFSQSLQFSCINNTLTLSTVNMFENNFSYSHIIQDTEK